MGFELMKIKIGKGELEEIKKHKRKRSIRER